MREIHKAERAGYKIVVREPDWSNSVTLWETFDATEEARAFLREVASGYPEGTIFWISVHWTKNYRPQTVQSFVVNEYGELTKRPRKWVPDERVPREQLSTAPEVPEVPRELVGLSEEEARRMLTLLQGMSPEETRVTRTQYKNSQRGPDFAGSLYYRPEELSNREWSHAKLGSKDE